jgi:predicted naringenin-chalcone synthase
MSLSIAGIGLAVPEHFIVQDEAAVLAETFLPPADGPPPFLQTLYRQSGVATRRSVLLESSSNGVPARQSFYPASTAADSAGPTTRGRMRAYEQHAGALGLAAAGAALAAAGTVAGAVTHLVTVSCTGFAAPGLDITLVRELGLPADVARTHVGFMGCHAALNGLRVAKAFVDADRTAVVLLCAVELCSLHYQYGTRADQLVANALFADGAGALVARREGPGDAWRLIDSRSAIVPETEDLMSWRIGDHGFRMTLSKKVPDVIHQRLRPWLGAWLARHALTIEQIGSWAIHPGGPKILAAVAEACGLPGERIGPSAAVLAELGNMSSPTVLFILDRLHAQAAARPCVALAFGPGLTIEAALLG